jgi:murein DD-endopeptidase MepM/ murein hydrolase activator NlpD
MVIKEQVIYKMLSYLDCLNPRDIFRMNASNKYGLAVPRNALERIDRTSSPARIGKLRNAIDFIVPKSTPVLAAAEGIVTLERANVGVGHNVHKGQTLGKVGLTRTFFSCISRYL